MSIQNVPYLFGGGVARLPDFRLHLMSPSATCGHSAVTAYDGVVPRVDGSEKPRLALARLRWLRCAELSEKETRAARVRRQSKPQLPSLNSV